MLKSLSIDPNATLLKLYATGDVSAGRHLIANLSPRIYAQTKRMVGEKQDVIEDIVQETFIKLWKIAHKWTEERDLVSTWCFKVSGNLCIDHLRKTKIKHESITETLISPLRGAEDILLQKEQARILEEALIRLPERQRQAVSLRHIENLPNPEIAHIMNINIHAVESLTARGLKNLRKHLS
jgi:RNA polymerase sigma-70 factor (ECF subfamily)